MVTPPVRSVEAAVADRPRLRVFARPGRDFRERAVAWRTTVALRCPFR
jgi:hypothetical protein